ncbi:MAG: rhomboid family intramembrane serine protease [Proteobacteria bacterium]|nr:rhomboid family intramembrane serine protease [Pseudomonadota bacterium]MBU1137528.1 rhomboid family intramembrane serine protease [Pseudomonadota bacterium]MBU1234971.1 rhomboid family intramembrane serine protease [Pseudomonadota bacterium]MBU1417592.1 rhomboid family intramembrane serine protease [Pseudomonadota bacterium]MBU1454743.1 rhomboid family intramembrane serine protease [Pseudomonadota bacterium]
MLPFDANLPMRPPSTEEMHKTVHSETVLETDEEQVAFACSLVLSSAGISHRLSQTPDALILRVTADDVQKAQGQIQAYFHENKNWPPKPVDSHSSFTPLLQPPTLLLIGGLSLFYSVTGPWTDHSFWFTRGAGDAEAILANGEWYRLITALSLHADPTHLLGNCLLGGFLFHFFCRLTGNGLGLFSMLLTATLANLINVVLHGTDHHFVGFSTAVFSIIGILAMLSRQDLTQTGYHRLMPFMAGAALLAMLGSSGQRTDLGAHFFGLCCGLLTGWLLSREPLLTLRHSMTFQTILFFLFMTGILVAWKSALL